MNRNDTLASRLLLALVDELRNARQRHADAAAPSDRERRLWGELQTADPETAQWLRHQVAGRMVAAHEC
jgi:hypothetical protein